VEIIKYLFGMEDKEVKSVLNTLSI